MDIEKLAREAGLYFDSAPDLGGWVATDDELRRFAALVAEEAAKVCETSLAETGWTHEEELAAVQFAAAHIRERFKA